jgi:amidase
MAGCPAVSIPCGSTAAGLPVGLQLIGAPGSDVSLLRTARAVETVLGDSSPVVPVTPAVPVAQAVGTRYATAAAHLDAEASP